MAQTPRNPTLTPNPEPKPEPRPSCARDQVPAAECGNSEAAVSVAWLPGSAHCLLAGTGFKWLRLYDLRSRPGASSLSCPAHAKVRERRVGADGE